MQLCAWYWYMLLPIYSAGLPAPLIHEQHVVMRGCDLSAGMLLPWAWQQEALGYLDSKTILVPIWWSYRRTGWYTKLEITTVRFSVDSAFRPQFRLGSRTDPTSKQYVSFSFFLKTRKKERKRKRRILQQWLDSAATLAGSKLKQWTDSKWSISSVCDNSTGCSKILSLSSEAWSRQIEAGTC